MSSPRSFTDPDVWPQVVEWSEFLYTDGMVFSILPMHTATLIVFLCFLWNYSNWPKLLGVCKAIKSVHRDHGLRTPFEDERSWLVTRLIRAFKKNVSEAGETEQKTHHDGHSYGYR